MTTEISTIAAALAHIPAGDRDTWVKMAMAVKSELGEDGFETWDQWSQADETYSATDARAVWKSIKVNGKITVGTLMHQAKQHGFKLNGDSKPKPPTAAEIEARRQAAGQAEAQQEADYAKAAERAQAIYLEAGKAGDAHGYLVKKGIRAHGARLDRDGRLVLPAFNSEGEIQSLQFIDGKGGKQFLPGGRMSCGRLHIGKLADGSTIIVAEGFATAVSIREACQATVVIAFSGGNMAKVAADLRRQYPKSPILIAGDLNQNPKSAEYAQAAAEAAKPATVVFPSFNDGRADGDFNDLSQAEGAEAVARQINAGLLPPSRFKLLTADDLMSRPPLRWRIRGVLPLEGLAAIFGPSGSGKSFLVIDMAMKIAAGEEWFKHRSKQGPVAYCAFEGEAGIAGRVIAYRSKHGDVPHGVRFMLDSLNLLQSNDVADLANAIKAAGCAGGVVILDTLNRAAPGADENSSETMGQIIDAAKKLQAAIGGLILLVHHSGKDSTKGLRGHSSLHAALDSAIEVRRDADRRDWLIHKSKDGSDSEGFPFKLSVVEIGQDDDGEAITSCTIEELEDAAVAVKRALPSGGNQRIAWNALGETLRNAKHFGEAGAPAGRPCVRLEDAIDAVAPLIPIDKKHQKQRAHEAITGLISRGNLGHREGWIWTA